MAAFRIFHTALDFGIDFLLYVYFSFLLIVNVGNCKYILYMLCRFVQRVYLACVSFALVLDKK